MTTKKRHIEIAKETSLWKLEMKVSKVNLDLLNLVAQGVNSRNKKYVSLVVKRNAYRDILIKKLNSWKKGNTKGSNPNYQDYLNKLEYQNKLKEAELVDS